MKLFSIAAGIGMLAAPTSILAQPQQEKPINKNLNRKESVLTSGIWHNGGSVAANFIVQKFMSPQYFTPVHCDRDLPHSGLGVDKLVAWYDLRENDSSAIDYKDFTITAMTPTENGDSASYDMIKMEGTVNMTIYATWHGYTLNSHTGDMTTIGSDGDNIKLSRLVSWAITYDRKGNVKFDIDWPDVQADINNKNYSWYEDFDKKIQLHGQWHEPAIQAVADSTPWDNLYKLERKYMDGMLHLVNISSAESQASHEYNHVINYTQKDATHPEGVLVSKRQRVLDLNELKSTIIKKAHNDSYKIDFHLVTQVFRNDELVRNIYTTPITGLKVTPWGDDNFIDLTMQKTDDVKANTYEVQGAEIRWLPDKPTDPEKQNLGFFEKILEQFKDDPMNSLGNLFTVLGVIF